MPLPKLKNRIKEMRSVKASQLRDNHKNWRLHPNEQRDALSNILTEIGIVDVLIAREDDDGSLVLIDGHLRKELIGEEDINVIILDIDEKESDIILATLDPLSAMAEADKNALKDLIDEIQIDNEDIEILLSDIEDSAGAIDMDFIYESDDIDKTDTNEFESTKNKDKKEYRILLEDARMERFIDSAIIIQKDRGLELIQDVIEEVIVETAQLISDG